MSASFFVSCRNAGTFYPVTEAGFELAKSTLLPSLSSGMTADRYEAAWDAVLKLRTAPGAELSRSEAVEQGVIDEDGDPCDGVRLYRAE